MAFIKNNHFAFEEGKQEKKEEKISIPLVFTREDGKIHGFVPGIVMKDIVCEDIAECEKLLKEHVKTFVKSANVNSIEFPYFPSNEHIKRDFKNVVLIKRLSMQTK